MGVIIERLNSAYYDLERVIETLDECAENDYVPDPDKIREFATKLLVASEKYKQMKLKEIEFVSDKSWVIEHLWEHHGVDAGSLKNMSEEELETLHSELHGSN